MKFLIKKPPLILGKIFIIYFILKIHPKQNFPLKKNLLVKFIINNPPLYACLLAGWLATTNLLHDEICRY